MIFKWSPESMPTSETDKNRSGLSSVMIRLTLCSWQRITLMQDCFTLNSFSSRSETAHALAVFTSKTRTCISPAAVALSQTYVLLNFLIGVAIWATHILEEWGSIWTLKIFAEWPLQITELHTNGYSCAVMLVSSFHILMVVSSPPLNRMSPSRAQLRAFTQLEQSHFHAGESSKRC